MFSWGNLRCGFTHLEILNAGELSLKKGDLLFLIGRNGVGKSTLLQTLAGTLLALSGQALYKGKPFRQGTSLHQRPALLPANPLIHQNLTGNDLLDLFETKHSIWFDLELFKTLSLSTHMKKPIRQLSSGEQQRLLIGLILSHPSDVVLLDEPISFLDFNFAQKLIGLIERQRTKGRVFIIACHDFNWILQFQHTFSLLIEENKRTGPFPTDELLTSISFQKAFDLRSQLVVNPIDQSPLIALSPLYEF